MFETVTAKLESIPGLGDRVQLFLMGDPTPLTPEEVSVPLCPTAANHCGPDSHRRQLLD